ncbi:MAG: VOC family protein [Betaproteobacteria bacterium]|nr:VOC family protein [Betaproteobacteria bacterium]
MQIKALGHAVLRVRNLERSLAFYRDVLGMREVARYRGKMVFFSLGANHHDLGLMEIGTQAVDADPGAVGLYHLAFKVGDSLDELRAVKAELEASGVEILGMSDHRVSQSLYIVDPDGIELELYVDADPALWRADPAAVAHIGPLSLA